MRLLLMGDTGFIGKHILGYLPKYIDIYRFSNNKNDIHNYSVVTKIIQDFRPTHCLYLAWYTKDGYAYAPENIVWVESSIHLIKEFYTQGGQRFVGVGSCFEYAPTDAKCAEALTPTQPKTLYGKAKLALGSYLAAYASANAYSWAWCRPFYITGPGEAPHRLVPIACAALLRGKDFMTQSAQSVLDYMDVRDVAVALVKTLFSSYCGFVNIGTGHGIAVSELLQVLHGIIGGKGRILSAAEHKKAVSIVADTSVLNTYIGFAPQYSLHETLAACYAYIQSRE